MNQEKWDFVPALIYSFIVVSLPTLEHPYNNWNSTHGAQGFSWRPGSVSFGTFDADDDALISVELQNSYISPTAAIRIIKVPFQVEEDGITLIDPLTQEWRVPIPEGNYALFFAIEPFEASWKYSLTFVSEKALSEAEIILADEWLSPPEELLMHAEPA